MSVAAGRGRRVASAPYLRGAAATLSAAVACFLVVFAAVPVLAVSPSAIPGARLAGGSGGTDDVQALRGLPVDRIRGWLNQTRIERSLGPLAGDPALDRLARAHSLEMARRGRVTHHSEVYGIGTERRVKLAFPAVETLGENVARNRSLEALHEALMGSRGHRRNRLHPGFTHVGVGLARRGDHQIYLTEVFVAAPRGRALGPPAVVYAERSPDTFAREEAPRSGILGERLTVRSPRVGDPDDPQGLTQLGIREFRDGEYGTAAATFRSALELDPDYRYARFNLARTLVRLGEPGEAKGQLDILLRDEPDDADARFTYGVAALLEGDYREAEDAFRRVLGERREDAGAWYNLGLALEYQDRLEEAAAVYAQALHLDPGHREAALGLARVEGS